jgi:hypothetical protein
MSRRHKMAKHTPFFKFDSAAWLGGSIQFTDLESKGLFIDLCALYWESQKPIKIDTKFKVRTRCPEGTLNKIIGTLSDLDIIAQTEHGITIPFLDSLMSDREVWLKKCSESGKKSAINKGTSSNKKEDSRKKKEETKEIEERKKEFKELTKNKWSKLGGVKYLCEDEAKNFFDYWTEHGENDKLMRFEKEKSFGVGRRLGTWKKSSRLRINPNVRQGGRI